MLRLIAVVHLVILVLVAPRIVNSEPIKTQTLYWTMDLSSPQVASQSFLQFMGEDRYDKAFICFDFQAQRVITRAMMRLDFSVFGVSKDWPKFVQEIYNSDTVHLMVPAYAFDQAMAYLRKNGGSFINWWSSWEYRSERLISPNLAVASFEDKKGKSLRLFVRKTSMDCWRIVGAKENNGENIWPENLDEILERYKKIEKIRLKKQIEQKIRQIKDLYLEPIWGCGIFPWSVPCR